MKNKKKIKSIDIRNSQRKPMPKPSKVIDSLSPPRISKKDILKNIIKDGDNQ